MIGAAAVLALASLLASPDVRVQRRKVVTSDAYAIALYRYEPPGGGTSRPPVLLVPDVGIGREAYDAQGQGLAWFLLAHGRDTFVVELRGQGQAASQSAWHLADWVQRDLPAALAAVAAVHPGPVDLVADGYAGTLAMAATTKELSGRIRRVVSLGTPVLPEVPNPRVREILEGGGRFSGAALDGRTFELVFTHGGHFPAGRVASLRAAFTDLSPAASKDLLEWMTRSDLPLADGSTVRTRLADYDRPTLLALPLLDDFAHPEFASCLREVAPRAPVKTLLLTRWERTGEDYSHLSVLQGTDAPEDVWTPALRYLDLERVAP